MFVGCSEISISVIAKHAQHDFGLSGGLIQVFQCLGKQNSCWICGLLEEISTPADTELI